jgi:hypothetical protein
VIRARSFDHERNDQIGSDLSSKGSFPFGIRCSVQCLAASSGERFQLTPFGCGVASPADRERGLPRQQSQSGSLPPVPVEVGRFHAFGASETALATAPFSIGTLSSSNIFFVTARTGTAFRFYLRTPEANGALLTVGALGAGGLVLVQVGTASVEPTDGQ